jgi:hypothetical protein
MLKSNMCGRNGPLVLSQEQDDVAAESQPEEHQISSQGRISFPSGGNGKFGGFQ